mgnify:CR=1 FL=1
MENKHTLLIQIVTAVVALVGALGASFLTSNYALESAKAQIEKDKLVLSASNANENAKEIRKRAEQYLISLFEIIEFLDADRVYVDEAEKRIAELNQLAQGLLIYGGPELGAASIRLNIALKNALISTSKKEAVDDMASVMSATKEWYPVYFSVINSYDRHTMPEKAKTDFKNQLLESLFKGLNKSMQPTAKESDD